MSVFPSDVRTLFPAVKRRVYLNAAASSPLCTPVSLAIEAHLRDTVENGDVHFGEWLAFREKLRARTARLVGAAADEVAFLGSTSHGFSAVGAVWAQRGVKRVLTLEGEFPSTTVPLLQAGLELEVVRAKADGSTSVEQLEAALGKEVGAVAVSAVQFASGYRLDLDGVAALCRARGLRLAVNAAQAMGQVPLDVGRLGCEFLAAPSHKWLMGGYGVGVFFARAGALEGVRLPWAGWFSTPEAQRWDAFAGAQKERESEKGFGARGVAITPRAPALEAGGTAWAPLHGFGAAVEILEQVGVENVLAHNQGLQGELREGLRRRGFRPNAPDEPAGLSGICVVPVEGQALAVVRALFREGVVTTPRGIGVRVSTHVFNDGEDVQRALAAFDKVGARPG